MTIRAANVTAQILYSSPEIFRSVTDILSLLEEPFARTVRVSNFTVQVLQLQSGIFLTVSDTLDFSEQNIFINAASDRQIIEDVISFSDGVFSPSNPFVEDVLSFSQTPRPSILNKPFFQNLGIHDGVGYCFGAPWSAIVVEDILSLTHAAGSSSTEVIVDTISFIESTDNRISVDGDGHFLDFVQSVSVGRGLNITSQLEIVQTIQTFSNFLREIEHTDVVEHAMTFYIENGCNKKQYARFVGEGTANPIAEQRLVFESSFVLEAIDTNEILVIRSPDTDDGDRLGFNRINRETRGGELNVFSDPVWAEVNTLVFTITALPDGKGNCPDTLEQTLTFLQNNLGKEIYLHDWTGTSWRGVIITPDESATEDSDGYWTVTFEFEGIAADGGVPNNNLAISDSLTMNADWARPVVDIVSFSQLVHVGGDIQVDVSDTLIFSEEVTGVQEITIMEDTLSGAGAILQGTSPTTGNRTWRAHTEYRDNGLMDGPVSAGAYYGFTPVDGTIYQLTFLAASMTPYNDNDNTVWGFFEDISDSSVSNGGTANGDLNPTAAKAVHLMRETSGGIRNNAYRRGSDSDGTADTIAWTDGTLNASPDNVFDLRLTLDTISGAGKWTASWEAKDVGDPTYTEVGSATTLLSENISAVGWSNDSDRTESTLGNIKLLELRAI